MEPINFDEYIEELNSIDPLAGSWFKDNFETLCGFSSISKVTIEDRFWRGFRMPGNLFYYTHTPQGEVYWEKIENILIKRGIHDYHESGNYY